MAREDVIRRGLGSILTLALTAPLGCGGGAQAMPDGGIAEACETPVPVGTAQLQKVNHIKYEPTG